MITIEEKAYNHANRLFPEIVNKYLTGTWSEFRKEIIGIYLAGAKEALQSQWRSVEEKLPGIDEEVLVIFSQAYTPAHKEMAVAYTDGEDWYTIDGSHIRPSHWMRIPEPPKDDKK